MKAVVYSRYGSPNVLNVAEADTPSPAADEVLVKVCASSVNAADLDLLRGKFFIRLEAMRRPKYSILGSDIAGRVEALGSSVTEFQVGDKVFADLTEHGFGSFAEFVSVPAGALTRMPTGLTYQEAAAVPSAGGVAFLTLQAKRPIEAGQKVLINGAGGGMGAFALQIAKLRGAEVTGVDREAKFDTMRSSGADHVIDFTRDDFTNSDQQYDLILDVAAHHSVFSYKRALSDTGICVLVGGATSTLLQVLLIGTAMSRSGGKNLGMVMAYPGPTELVALARLLDDKTVVPVVDRCYGLDEVPAALRYLEEGRAKGKVVITVSDA